MRLNWIANQPTPYHFYFHSEVRKEIDFNFKVYYTLNNYKLLPYEEQHFSSEDIFLPQLSFVQMIKYYFYLMFSNDQFIITGWDNKYLLSTLIIRRVFKKPFCFLTDSVENKKHKYFGIKKYLLKGATFVLTTGEFGINSILISRLVDDRTKLLNLPFFVRPLEMNLKIESKDFDHPTFLILARLVHNKGIDIAIKAFALLKEEGITNLKLIIGGVGPELPELINECISSKVSDIVEFCGWINEEAKYKLMDSSIALIHPVRGHDPFPLVVNESLSRGLPVIGTNKAGSVVEFVRNGYNGYVIEAESIKGIADSIKQILTKTLDEYRCMSENAKRLTIDFSAQYGISTLRQIVKLNK